ncbi:MAG TPA: M15 family metallopeptidase [Galbitalea sp.]|jgi:D-alanyl-D-alanine carboxypeptidase|nr:M15 family metallopeptidase [Galbitalea sp.]
MSETGKHGPAGDAGRHRRAAGAATRNRLVLWIIGAIVVIGAIAIVVVFVLRDTPATTPSASKTTSSTTTVTPLPTPTPTPTPTFDKTQFSNTDPSSDWVLVNKQNPLSPKNYVPPLVPLNLPGVKGDMRPEAAAALQQMFADYHTQTGLQLSVVSPYRSYNTQVSTYNGWVSRLGQAQADRQSARPGFSEHQTGLAVDIDTATSEAFGATPAGMWLAQNSWKYGFIVRYQQGQEAITGYEYEPWHFRYVGVPLATELQKEGFPSLETFFGYPPAPNY